MELKNFGLKNFQIIMIICIIIPQILLLAMVLIKPLGEIFFETDNIKTTILLFIIYYVVFSVIAGIKSYKYISTTVIANVTFILCNVYLGLLYHIILYLCGEFLESDDRGWALNVILLMYIAFSVISIVIFLITSVFTKIFMKSRSA